MLLWLRRAIGQQGWQPESQSYKSGYLLSRCSQSEMMFVLFQVHSVAAGIHMNQRPDLTYKYPVIPSNSHTICLQMVCEFSLACKHLAACRFTGKHLIQFIQVIRDTYETVTHSAELCWAPPVNPYLSTCSSLGMALPLISVSDPIPLSVSLSVLPRTSSPLLPVFAI